MWQISAGHAGQTNLVWRSGYAGTWSTPWWTVLHTGNFTSYAASASHTHTSFGNLSISPSSASWAEGIAFTMPSTNTWGGLRWRRERGNADGNWYIGYVGFDSSDDLVFGSNNGGAQIDNVLRLYKSGNVLAQGSFTAAGDIACNTLNTGNYINIGYARNNGESISTSSFRGIDWHTTSDFNYYIGKPAGSWVQPLHIHFYTGVRLRTHSSYGGTQFFNINGAVTTASVNDGDNNLRGFYDIIAYASDKRLKENVQVIDNAIDKVKQLTGMTYTWNSVGSQYGWAPSSEREAGVFAQDVQAVLPEAVKLAPFDNDGGNSKSGENFLTVKYEKIVPLLIEAIKEQQQQIEDLKSELNALTK
jgi:hypothetical protein